MLVDSVDLEDLFCQVNANSRKLHGERPSRFKWLINVSTLALRCRYGGAFIPSLTAQKLDK